MPWFPLRICHLRVEVQLLIGNLRFFQGTLSSSFCLPGLARDSTFYRLVVLRVDREGAFAEIEIPVDPNDSEEEP